MKTVSLIFKLWLCLVTAQVPVAIAQITSTQQQQLGDKNFLVNAGFESGKAKWAAYRDTAQVLPVDGTGGSPAITITSSTTSPLADKASGILTKTASNLQGEGFSQAFTIDALAKGKVLTISGTYQIASGTYSGGTSTTDSDVEVYIYDVDAGQIIQPAGYKLNGGVSGINYDISATFQTNTTSTNYRLIFHVATTSASAYSLKFDNLYVGLKRSVTVPVVTDWQSYVPALTNFGTATNISFRWRQVGASMEIEGKFTAGSTTASEARIELPSGKTISSSVPSTTSVAGQSTRSSSASTYLVVLKEPSVTYVVIASQDASRGSLTKLAANYFSAGEVISVKAEVPIDGWSSNLQTSSESGDARVIAASYWASTNQSTSSTAPINFDSRDYDLSGSATTGSAWKYTAPIPGVYNIAILVGPTTATNAHFAIYKNGSNYKYIAYSSGGIVTTGSADIQLNAGDYIDIRSNVSISVYGGVLAGAGNAHIEIKRISGPSQIAATESVNAAYVNTNTVNFAGTGTSSTITYNSSLKDSHSSMNPSSGVYTVPVSGTYLVSAAIYAASNGATITAGYDLAITMGSVGFNRRGGEAMGSGSAGSVEGTGMLYLNAGQTIYVQARAYYSAGTPQMSNGLVHSATISITRVGN